MGFAEPRQLFPIKASSSGAGVDGVYQVKTSYLCAGYVVKGGMVIECAPILRKQLDYWMTQSVRVGESNE